LTISSIRFFADLRAFPEPSLTIERCNLRAPGCRATRSRGIIQRVEGHEANRLLSVQEVASRLGVKSDVVSYYVANGDLTSLDEGRLVAKGIDDVPLIREAEVARMLAAHDRLQGEDDVIYPKTIDEHPGLLAASQFLLALKNKEADAAFALSSEASREHFGKPVQLLRWWRNCLGGSAVDSTGLTSAVYTLHDEGAIAVRFVSDAPAGGVAFRRPTIVPGAVPIALVMEGGGWKVDYPLQVRRKEWEAQAGMVAEPQSEP
jgi:hypothetical protein